MAEENKTTRRGYLKTAGGLVAGAALASLGWGAYEASKPPAPATGPGMISTVTSTVTETATQAKPPPEYTYYLVSHSPTSIPFWATVAKGWADACALYNLKGIYVGPKNETDTVGEMQLLETAIGASPDGIAIVLSAYATDDAPLRKAMSEGIDVLAYNVIDPRPKDQRIPYLLYIGEDSYGSGYMQTDVGLTYFETKFGRSANRAVFPDHGPTSLGMQERYRGFNAACQKHGVKTIDHFITVYDPVKTSEDARAYLTAHPDTEYVATGYIEISAWWYDVLAELGMADTTVVSGIDLTPRGLNYILAGKIYNTIDQQPYLQGYYSAMCLWMYKKYKFIPNDIYTGPYPVNKSNAAILLELTNQGYR